MGITTYITNFTYLSEFHINWALAGVAKPTGIMWAKDWKVAMQGRVFKTIVWIVSWTSSMKKIFFL